MAKASWKGSGGEGRKGRNETTRSRQHRENRGPTGLHRSNLLHPQPQLSSLSLRYPTLEAEPEVTSRHMAPPFHHSGSRSALYPDFHRRCLRCTRHLLSSVRASPCCKFWLTVNMQNSQGNEIYVEPLTILAPATTLLALFSATDSRGRARGHILHYSAPVTEASHTPVLPFPPLGIREYSLS